MDNTEGVCPWLNREGHSQRIISVPEKRWKMGFISLYDVENNAARLLGACARQAGYKFIEIYFKDWINNKFDPPKDIEIKRLLELIGKHNLNIIGVSVRASAYHKVAAQLTAVIRKHFPGIVILWGGTHTVLAPEKCIQEADIVCRGEAEITLIELLDRLSADSDITELPNIWVRYRADYRQMQGRTTGSSSHIFKNPVGPNVQNLNLLPFRDFYSDDKYFILGRRLRQGDPMIGDSCFQMMNSRGCVFHCAYCYNSELSELYKDQGRYFRTRSVDSVLAEIKRARTVFTNMKRIRFDDEVFLFSDDWYEEFARRYPVEIGLPFEVFTEPKLVKKSLFELLRRAGLDAVYMGIQSSCRVNSELYDRSGSDDQLRRCAAIFAELGLDARYHVMMDDKESTWEDKRHLFDLLMSFPKGSFQLYLFSVVIFPNTMLARKLLAEGKITENDLEGERNKTFQQIRVSLNYPRPPEDMFWAAMFVLVSKSFLSDKFLYFLADNKFLRRHPKVLALFAQLCNIIKMAGVAFEMTYRGEMNWTLIRRWLNLNSLISQ
ncbi:MAG: B12-binding domain-containing radical SAM protein [Candidatus Bruticola sp.]